MANEEHLAILKQGVKVWNRWRAGHPTIRPELGGCILREASLTGADLNRANLRGADLYGANLREANLRGADLSRANLNKIFLNRADLSRADLGRANLYEARLDQTDLSGARLGGADLNQAFMWNTVLNDLDLRQVKGLETVRHGGPSDIGIQTIYRSHGEIPEDFLRGAGVPESFIEYMRSLIDKPIDYYSAFISYSSKDEEFARRLYNDLQGSGVRCWFAPEDLKIGDETRTRIDESIRLHDKLLLILSKHSIASAWVQKEVETAFEKERQQKRLMLFPIRLDNTVMNTPAAWAADIRRMRNIGDFIHWKDHNAYQKAFERLLRDLKAASTTT